MMTCGVLHSEVVQSLTLNASDETEKSNVLPWENTSLRELRHSSADNTDTLSLPEKRCVINLLNFPSNENADPDVLICCFTSVINDSILRDKSSLMDAENASRLSLISASSPCERYRSMLNAASAQSNDRPSDGPLLVIVFVAIIVVSDQRLEPFSAYQKWSKEAACEAPPSTDKIMWGGQLADSKLLQHFTCITDM